MVSDALEAAGLEGSTKTSSTSNVPVLHPSSIQTQDSTNKKQCRFDRPRVTKQLVSPPIPTRVDPNKTVKNNN